MSREDRLAWLAAWQAELTAVLRTPLEVHEGVLRANPAAYSSRAREAIKAPLQRTAAAGLAVYNRQYWLRLLRATQDALPLTCRLLGAWHFNSLAMPFLLAHPPRAHDLGAVAGGFDRFLATELRGDVTLGATGRARVVPRAALLEAARIDLAFRRSFVAPAEVSFRPGASLQPDVRLSFSRALTLLQQRWPLLQLREGALAADAEKSLALPERLPAAQAWVIFRSSRGTGRLLLEPQHARLLELLRTDTLASALGRLEAECPPAARDALPAQVQTWLASSTRLGFFTKDPV